MRDFSVTAIANGSGCEQRRRLAHPESRQKPIEPARIICWPQQPTHALGFHECAREKIVAPRLPRLAVHISLVPRLGFGRQCVLQRAVAGDIAVLQRERDGTSAVEVGSDPDWICCLWHENQKPVGEYVGELIQRLTPLPVVSTELRREHK